MTSLCVIEREFNCGFCEFDLYDFRSMSVSLVVLLCELLLANALCLLCLLSFFVLLFLSFGTCMLSYSACHGRCFCRFLGVGTVKGGCCC